MTHPTPLLKKAFLATLPIMAGYLVLGMGFGMILQAKGLHMIHAFLMSLLIYAGSMQFVAIPLLTSGASLLTLALTTLMVNARHLFYGISMVDQYRGAGAKKPYLIFALTDETYSLVVAENRDIPPEDRHRYFFYVSALDQVYWVLGSLAGAALGTVLPFSTQGMDFALTALFVTIFMDQWRENKNHLSALLGVGVSLVCLLVLGPDRFLIPTMLLITGCLCLVRRREEPKYE